jgi:TetR/AcrR family transcriptional regulator, transcriptional repressor for nem operon
MLANVTDDVQRRARLTPKGERTRARIVDAAAGLIYERGVAGTTLEDIRAAAEVSGSQLSHYFAGKDELVQAVIDHQAGVIVGSTERAGLATSEGLRAWRDMIVAAARSTDGRGGCPLGSLGSQLAETDPQARDLIAGGFERWSAVIADGLRALPAAGHLPAGISSDDLSVTLLAALQGGLLLAQVQRDTGPLETAVDTILALAGITDGARSTDGLGRAAEMGKLTSSPVNRSMRAPGSCIELRACDDPPLASSAGAMVTLRGRGACTASSPSPLTVMLPESVARRPRATFRWRERDRTSFRPGRLR